MILGEEGWSNDLTMEEEMEEITFDVNRVLLGKFDGKEMLMVYLSVFWGEEKEEKEIFIAKIVCRRSYTAIKNQKI